MRTRIILAEPAELDLGKQRHRKGKSKREPPRCPLCDVPLDAQATCARCGARLLAPAHDAAAAPRVELAGAATAVAPATTSADDAAQPAPGPSRWRHTHDLALPTGRAVRVHTADDTELFCDPALDPARASAAEAVAVGELSAEFVEHHGGLRDAAERVDLLRASALSLGPGAHERLQRGLEHHDLLADPAAHSMARAPESERSHSDELELTERTQADGRWEVAVRWGEGSFGKALMLLQLMAAVGALGALACWQIGKTAGVGSFAWWVAVVLSAAAVLGVAGVLLIPFRSSRITIDPQRLRTRELPLPWPVPRALELPVSELSHVVQRERSLHVVRFGGAEHELLPWAGERDRLFLRDLLRRRLELVCREESEPPGAEERPPATGVRRVLASVGRALHPVRHLLFLLCLLPLTCPYTPVCVLTTTRDVWLEAQRLANACPKVTARLGEDVTWAFGQVFTRDLEDGYGYLAVKGDQRRGRMTLRFSVPVSEGVHLQRVDIEVDGDVVCAICCAVYGEDPKHTGGGRRKR